VFTAALFISVFRFVIAARAVCAPGDEALNKNPSLKNFNRARGFVFKLSFILRLLDATLR
jgi:hypothetical protein